MLDILVEYYKAAYKLMNFKKPFTANLDNSITVQGRINQYGRCWIGSEIFGSAISSRHIKSSFVLAQFVNQDGSVEIYPGQVQYFFTHHLNLLNGTAKHIFGGIKL